MRWLLVLVVLLSARAAHADGDRFALLGLGSSMTSRSTGWAFRVDNRIDTLETDDDENVVLGANVGFDAWSAGSHWGFSFPIGMYAGAQVFSMRSTVGIGFGMWTFEKTSSDMKGGFSPYANATLEKTAGELMLAVQGRIARQAVFEMTDHNVYSVMLMAGRRIR